MNLLMKQLNEAIRKRQFCAIVMANGLIHYCFINDFDEYHIKISYLDYLPNSQLGKMGQQVRETLGEGTEEQVIEVETDEEAESIDRKFVTKLIRLDMVDSIDFGCEHILEGNTTTYVEFYKTHILKTIFDEKAEQTAARKTAKTKATPKTNRTRISKTNNTSSS